MHENGAYKKHRLNIERFDESQEFGKYFCINYFQEKLQSYKTKQRGFQNECRTHFSTVEVTFIVQFALEMNLETERQN